MSSYFVARNGVQSGPFDEAEVQRQVRAGALSPKDYCWREDMVGWRPIAEVVDLRAGVSTPPPLPPEMMASAPAPGPHISAPATPLFLYIPTHRLIWMSIVSFGIYEAYWIYRNWSYIKERDHLDIRPFWRGFFGLFYCHSLLRRMYLDPEARTFQMPTFSPSSLATWWLVLRIVSNVIGRFPTSGPSMVAAFIPSFLCLTPVQQYVNDVTAKRNPGMAYYRWSWGHIACLVPGLLIWAALIMTLGAD